MFPVPFQEGGIAAAARKSGKQGGLHTDTAWAEPAAVMFSVPLADGEQDEGYLNIAGITHTRGKEELLQNSVYVAHTPGRARDSTSTMANSVYVVQSPQSPRNHVLANDVYTGQASMGQEAVVTYAVPTESGVWRNLFFFRASALVFCLASGGWWFA